ncbi:archaeal proteasome endopeptidase complex subunit alpha [Fervidicoccus fontis]|jgi:proteasome alpha subunit|uniref:Proteasome subunit alpha n=2 Tax=Fervidicoccus fontis TaxID=683846 RepID=I0A143_FERFK|nr:archaeal proteasome endopeptidase complex subunit alpha [Fervidicoccus fontis]AFH42700.1 proteasome subunit Alpha [Fervidicoccus fontis Kam940]MBE9391279.1 archaeal proteasome endopeptidase complex subunit alpha [Fervidicoccus fontis]PMB78437.1 MAG: proteasome endopeptidase complex, archaeal, alpha subunit [Fervidicoccus fontis]HEW63702.1 archaeal proteasome endopeptidase complex subunit alpha [Fervidicoccus fontis]
MAFSPAMMGYDRALTVFSPDGRLYQVQYAFEAVKQGWSTVGIKTPGGVVLAAEKAVTKSLMDVVSIEKVSMIDTHIGVTFAGFGGDGRVLIEYARQIAVSHRLTYGEPIPIEYLTKQVSDLKQAYTQHGGVRPFGVSLLIGGIDSSGPQLFKTDPAGQYFGYFATSMGRGEAQIEEKLEKNYRKDMSLEEGILLALKVLKESSDQDLKAQNFDVGIILAEKKEFRKLTLPEIEDYLKKI